MPNRRKSCIAEKAVEPYISGPRHCVFSRKTNEKIGPLIDIRDCCGVQFALVDVDGHFTFFVKFDEVEVMQCMTNFFCPPFTENRA